MPYYWAPLANKLLPTIAEYKRAYRMAEAAKGADPRPLLAIIARLQEGNSRLHGLIHSAHSAITGFPWDIVPADEENEKANTIAEETKARLLASRLHHYFNVIIDAEFYGLTGLRQVWKDHPLGLVAQIGVIPTTELHAAPNADGIRTPVLIADTPKFQTIEIGIDERRQYIFSEFNPFVSTRPEYIGGLLRGAILLSLLKNFNWHDWAQFNELFAQPFRVGKYKAGTSADDKTVARQALEEFGREAWALISEDVMFEFIEAVKNGTVTAYEKFLEKADSELAILVNGESNTSELPDRGGSRAAVQTLKLVRDDRMWDRINRIQDVVNEQYIAVDYFLNVSEKDLSLRPRFGFLTDDPEDREANARIVVDLRAAGYTLDPEEVGKKTGFTVLIPEVGSQKSEVRPLTSDI